MPLEESIAKEIDLIKNHGFDIRNYLSLLFNQLLNKELINNSKIDVIDELITQDSLTETLDAKFKIHDYVILFYAHKPHSIDISPEFPLEKAAHTSVLFCKITEQKISNILNIDCYNFTHYIDIIGETRRATPNPDIKQRLVIDAIDPQKQIIKPLQSPNWYKMNCAIYAFSVVKAMLELFVDAPETLNNIFDSEGIVSEDSKKSLKNNILAGMTGTYVEKINGQYYKDQKSTDVYHQNVRETLAKNYQCEFLVHASRQHIYLPQQQFEKVLSNLENEISCFKIKGDQHHNFNNIIKIANELHKELNQLAKDFFSLTPTTTSKNKFKINCQQAINKAKPILEKEPGFLFILLDLTKAIANIIVYCCSLGTTNNFFKRPTKTTEQAAKQLQSTIIRIAKDTNFTQ